MDRLFDPPLHNPQEVQGAPGGNPPLMALLGGSIFAAQMLNFPVAGGTTGHLVGAAACATELAVSYTISGGAYGIPGVISSPPCSFITLLLGWGRVS
ncbi:MAG: energy-coupling factor ABC transporter permease [Thermoplasmata archaeon]|nr:energy-coupling factor ABC transporter permease [Thermoplasmata archaeon]